MSHQSDLIAADIQAYLHQHENKELLRLLTCGSVDDGKSTLIGRLLHDSKMIYEDQLAALQSDNAKVGNAGDALDLALLVDGLQAEREQGITIDVAYRYFSTAKRKFIIADTPGHEQYTRNMVTGASTCDLAIILIDARHGVQVQTRRHSFIVSLLGLKHTVVAINKMDLVDFSEARYEAIKADYLAFAAQLELPDIQFVPLSALNGDNVVNASEQMLWYRGAPLMETLENVAIARDQNFTQVRFPVQYVNRPHQDFRGYCGTLTAGILHPGDAIKVLPSGQHTHIKSIIGPAGELEEAFAPMAITLTLTDEIDVSRGDMIVQQTDSQQPVQRLQTTLVWMAEQPLQPGKQYQIKLLTQQANAVVSEIRQRIDVNTLTPAPADQLALNEIGQCDILLDRPVLPDDYRQLRATGSFILIDKLSNATVAAGMIQPATEQQHYPLCQQSVLTRQQRGHRFQQHAALISITGTPENRQTLIYSLEQALFQAGHAPATLVQQQLPEALQPHLPLLAEQLQAAGLLVLCDQAIAGALQLDADWLLSHTKDDPVAIALAQVRQQVLL